MTIRSIDFVFSFKAKKVQPPQIDQAKSQVASICVYQESNSLLTGILPCARLCHIDNPKFERRLKNEI